MATPLPPEAYGALPSAQDLAAMGMTAQQFADLQSSIANIDLTGVAVNPFGTIDLIGGRSPYSIDESKYMVKAPLSNKGNPTSTLHQSSNDFFVYDNQPVRLVDNATKQVVFEGAGPEDARKASELAAQLTAEGGRKAAWDIQVGPQTLDTSMMGVPTRPEGSWMSVAEEKKNKSALGKIGSVLGTALPIAMIPLTMGASAPLAVSGAAGNIALGAGVGAASAGLKGQNILKGAVMGGLTSAGGQFLSGPLKGVGLGTDAARAVGTGLGATAGGLATGQSLKNSLIGGVAAGGTTYLGGKLFAPKADPLMEWAKGQGIFDPASLGNSPIADGYGGGVLPSVQAPVSAPTTSGGGLTVTGTRIASGAPFTPAVNNIFNPARYSGGENVRDTKATEELPEIVSTAILPSTGAAINIPGLSSINTPETIVTAQRQTPVAKQPSFAVNDFGLLDPEIIATARKEAGLQDKDQPLAVNVASSTGLTKPEIEVTAQKDKLDLKNQEAVGGPYIPPKTEIVVTGDKGTPKLDEGSATEPFDLLDLIQDPKVREELKSGRDDGKTDLDKILNYLRLAGLGLSVFGGAGGGKGGGSAGKYTSTKNLSPTFSAKLPTPGTGGAFTVGGLGPRAPGAAGTFAARPVTDWYRYGMGRALDIPEGTDLSRATSPYAGYGPGTLGEETYRAVSGIPEEPVGMYGGGDVGYSRGSSRESFLVEGPGDGRSDDIPAMLSDGEYVVDAESLALLGNGSRTAGAKKMDEFRINLRKHKGKNLAKGKFSAKAKRPEAYMSGGRI